MQHAEDLLAEKDRDYTQGFLDATNLFNDYANRIMDSVPESKRFSSLLATIENVYSCALEQHEEHVKQRFGIILRVEKENEKHGNP